MKRNSLPLWIFLGFLILFFAVYRSISQPFVRVQQLSTAVTAPNVITVTTNAQYIFTASSVREDGRVLKRGFQNIGTNAVIYAIGSVASTASLHGVVAGGSAVRDGLGSFVDLSAYPGQVSVVTESGTSIIAPVELTQ